MSLTKKEEDQRSQMKTRKWPMMIMKFYIEEKKKVYVIRCLNY